MRREHKKIKVKMKIINLLLCLAGIAILVSASTGRAEPNDINEPIMLGQQDSGVILDAEPADMELGGISADEPVQSIYLKQDMSIRDVLRFLAVKYRKNIIPSAKVGGKANVTTLYGVTFEEALDAVLGRNFYYEFGENFIRVYTKEEYDEMTRDRSQMTSRVFTLYYINAAEVKALITPILSESGKIGTTTPAAVNTEAGDGGDKLSMRDTIVVYDYPERLDQIGLMIKEIDVKPQQILIEVTVLKAKLTEQTQFGIDWSSLTHSTVSKSVEGVAVSLASGVTGGLSVGFTNNDRIVSMITALEDVTDTTVLANPKIMALNKQAGSIKIGDETGYLDSTTQNQIGTTQSIAFLESGTLLRFRPFICDDGYIRMEINPEESTASLRSDSNSTTKIPSKSITQLKTNIMVKNGKTIIIGGLFKEDLTNSHSQVPVLGDIPFVGAIFKKTNDTNIRSELVILITPHIIDETSDIAAKDKQEDISRIVSGSRKRISSISRVRIYEDAYAKAVKYYSEKKYDKALAELNWIIGFRPDALEAVKLKEKILAEAKPDEHGTLERIMLEQVRKEQEINWSRR